MARYRLRSNGVKDTESGALIPNDLENRHWKEYQAWLAEGNTPDPIQVSVPPAEEELIQAFVESDSIQNKILIAMLKSVPRKENLSNNAIKSLLKEKLGV